MSDKIRGDYYRDVIEKRYCKICQKQFAIGRELGESVPVILCPYCGSTDTHASIWDEEDRGCAGIYFHKINNRYYDRCCLCEQELREESIVDVHLCKGCVSFKGQEK